MAKRKREKAVVHDDGPASVPSKKTKNDKNAADTKPSTSTAAASSSTAGAVAIGKGELPTIQIVAGSYDRVLHGITATLVPGPAADNDDDNSKAGGKKKRPTTATATTAVTFADTFLFDAHSSAIRCLALSPASVPVAGQGQKVMLATGSTDERVNVYNLSAHPPSASERARTAQRQLSAAAMRPIAEDSRNRELGTLLHHTGAVTQLAFPTRGKLLSSAEDSTVAVTRTRDWSLLSTVRAPVPKPAGRPSGDTAALGATPRGVSAFAVHPSLKLMISVSRGERAMRLWNLVTGRRAGVLNFGRDVLAQVGEGARRAQAGTGEGRRVAWGASAADGDEFAVGFDRGALVFGMDSQPRCRVVAPGRAGPAKVAAAAAATKIHALTYLRLGGDAGEDSVLAVSTEDGRVLFFSTRTEDLIVEKKDEDGGSDSLPSAKLLAQLGGAAAGVTGRIKDFAVLPAEWPGSKITWYVVTGSSDGRIRVWEMDPGALAGGGKDVEKPAGKQVGSLLGTYGTDNRITCLVAFIMIPRPEGVEESEDEFGELDGDDDEEADSDGNE